MIKVSRPIARFSYRGNSKSINLFKSNRIYFFLLLFLLVGLYFFLDTESQSLVSHDEGLYARRAKLIVDTNNWFTPFSSAHHKTIGSYWLIAISIKIFGNSEFAVRLPSTIFSFCSLFILYKIGSLVFSRQVGYTACILLLASPLWIQYSRYASPDLIYVFFILLSLYSLFKLSNPNPYTVRLFYWSLIGFCLGISFFIRSYMVFIPMASILPFIIYKIKSENPKCIFSFIFSYIVGLLPTYINIRQAYILYGDDSYNSLFDFARKQALNNINIYKPFLTTLKFVYLTHPLSILFIIFFIFSYRYKSKRFDYLLFIYPCLSFLILVSMSTSYPHYFLFLLPSLSLLVSLYIFHFMPRFRSQFFYKSNYLFLLIISLLVIFVILFTLISPQLFTNTVHRAYLLVALSIILLSYLYSIYLFSASSTISSNLLKKFSLSIAIPQIISLSFLYNLGVLGSPNKSLKNFIINPIVQNISLSNNIFLYKCSPKIETLLSFYLPKSTIITDELTPIGLGYIISSEYPYQSSTYLNDSNTQLIFNLGRNYLIKKIK